MRYALVKDGKVANVILWDGSQPFNPPDGSTPVPISEEDFVDIGYAATYSDGSWGFVA